MQSELSQGATAPPTGPRPLDSPARRGLGPCEAGGHGRLDVSALVGVVERRRAGD